MSANSSNKSWLPKDVASVNYFTCVYLGGDHFNLKLFYKIEKVEIEKFAAKFYSKFKRLTTRESSFCFFRSKLFSARFPINTSSSSTI